MDRANSRFAFMIGMLLLSFVAVEARLFFLQVRKHPDRKAEALDMYYRDDRVLAARGSILMSNDYPLAESVPAVRIWSDSNWTCRKEDRTIVNHRDDIAAMIQEALGRPIENLRTELDKPGYRLVATEALGTGERSVKPLADGDQIKNLLDLKREGKLPGITIEKTWLRSYPQNSLASNVVGFVDNAGKGQAGVELSFDSDLTGVDGHRTLLRDVAGRPIYDVGCQSIAPTPGHDVHLTLDVVLQFYLEEALAKIVKEHRPKWVAGIVLDPRNSEVLAMASAPSFDPNHYSNYDIENHQNRCVTYTYTPGSSFKPFMMGMSLEWTNLPLKAEFDCSTYTIDGRSIRDTHKNGRMTPGEIMAESSNIGMCRVVMRVCPDSMTSHEKQLAVFGRVRSLLTDLGFGKRLEIGLPGESAGRVQSLNLWSRRYTLASLAFGHEIAVTPLQLATSFAVFANDGIYTEPTIVEKVVAQDGTVIRRKAPQSRRVFTRTTVEKIRDMLVSVVDEGTGTMAAIKDYTVAGKTSTAQWESDRSKYTSSFAGFAPARDPRLLVSIVVDQPRKNGHFGGTVAAPAARDVLARGLAYLRVPRDRSD